MSHDFDIEWAKVLGWVVATVTGLLTTLVAWAGSRQVARIDDHGKRLDALERTQITKSDLMDAETRIRADVRESRSHTAERLGDIAATADKAHERIDRLLGKN